MKQKDFIVITGCDSGLGEAFCRTFLKEGYPVIASYLEPPASFGKDHIPLFLDQRNEESVAAFAERVLSLTETDRIDTLIVNAGIVRFGPVRDLPLSYYREVMEVNLFGTIRIVQALLDKCVQSRTKILLHSSLAGRIALPFFSPLHLLEIRAGRFRRIPPPGAGAPGGSSVPPRLRRCSDPHMEQGTGRGPLVRKRPLPSRTAEGL